MSAPRPLPTRAETLGHALRRLRKRRRLEPHELAARLGIEPAELVRIERGTHRVGLGTLVRILSQLGATPADLVLGDPGDRGGPPVPEAGDEPQGEGGPAFHSEPIEEAGPANPLAVWHPVSLL